MNENSNRMVCVHFISIRVSLMLCKDCKMLKMIRISIVSYRCSVLRKLNDYLSKWSAILTLIKWNLAIPPP